MFKFWSEIKKEARDELLPDFGFRSWSELETDDKRKIWLYLWEKWFFDSTKNDIDAFCSYEEYIYQDRDKTKKIRRITFVLDVLNQKYKAKTYARSFLDDRNVQTALEDFYNVFAKTKADAALAASVFHYRELTVGDVKKYLSEKEVEVRL